MVAKVARERTEKEPNILIERVELIAQRLARAEKITANFAVHLQEKTRLGLVIGVIGGEKIGEQFPIFINRINGVAEKSRLATQPPNGGTIGITVASDCKCFVVLHRWPLPV